MNEEISFEIGEKYENMKGIFEVIAIHRDSMEIRWESGEEISTPIALQQRIIERIRYEKALEKEQVLKEKKSTPSPARRSKPFVGLAADDFGANVANTTWRGRGQLGGAVTRLLAGESFKFNSWAVQRKPEVQWIDIRRQKQADLSMQAKFYARMDDLALYGGFYVPVPHPSPSARTDWDALKAWLDKSKNATWLNEQCAVHDLYLLDLSANAFEGRLIAEDNQWRHLRAGDTGETVDALGAYLKAAAKTVQMDLCIEKRIDRDVVIEKKQAIADDLAALFGMLVPLYTAAASRIA